MLNQILLGITIVLIFVMLYLILDHYGVIKLVLKKENKDEIIQSKTKLKGDMPELDAKESLEKQKEADLNYFNALYGDISDDNKINIMYGALCELKNMNYQLAQLINQLKK